MKLTEKNKRRIAALFFILFFIAAWKCSSQVERMKRFKEAPEITTIIPITPMKFDGGNNDTIYLSILADSISYGEYEYSLYCYFPRQVNRFSIELQYSNNTTQTFTPEIVLGHYIELPVKDKKMAYLQLDRILFYNNEVLQTCERIKTRDFFINFFKDIDNGK